MHLITLVLEDRGPPASALPYQAATLDCNQNCKTTVLVRNIVGHDVDSGRFPDEVIKFVEHTP